MFRFKDLFVGAVLFMIVTTGFAQVPMRYYPPAKVSLPQLSGAEQYVENLTTGEAPPLTYLEVVLVASEYHPVGEQIKPNQYQTMLRHGGSYLYVTTLELGYGVAPIVTMNGAVVPLGNIVAKVYVCLSASGKIRKCNKGETIQGFLYTWDVTQFGVGEFVYSQRASATSPRTFVRKLYIN